MSRYLSYLRKKMHGSQVNSEREPQFIDKKPAKNPKRIHRLRHNNVAPICTAHDDAQPKPPTPTELHSVHSDNDSLLDHQNYVDTDLEATHQTSTDEDEGVHNESSEDLIDDVMDEALIGLCDDDVMSAEDNLDSGFPCCTSPESEATETMETESIESGPHTQTSVSSECLSERTVSSTLTDQPIQQTSLLLNTICQFPVSISVISQSEPNLHAKTSPPLSSQSCLNIPLHCTAPSNSTSDQAISHSRSTCSDDEFESARETLSDEDLKNQCRSEDQSETTSIAGSNVSEESYQQSVLSVQDQPIITVSHEVQSQPVVSSEALVECEKMALIEAATSRSTEAINLLGSVPVPTPICVPLQCPEADVVQSALIQTVGAHHEQAEARLATRRAARAEARQMRLKELEKTQQKEEDEEEQQYTANSFTPVKADQRKRKSSLRAQNSNPKTPTRSSGRSSVSRTLVNSNASFSRRSSDGSSDEAVPGATRELKGELKEVEEKFRKAMITNAQLDNEKSTLTYEVDFIKDKFTELDESHTQLSKEHRKKCSENEQLRKVSNKLKEEMKMVRKILMERDELIQEYGLVVLGEEDDDENGAESRDVIDHEMADETVNHLSPRKIAIKKALLSQEAADLLSKGATSGSLDVRLKKYAEEKNELEDEVRRLKMQLEEELHTRRKENGLDNEKHKEASKSLNDYKLRAQKAEAEVSTLQANVARLESLVTRYKTQSEELEKSEEELKLEKRKALRELRDAQNRLEELEVTSAHLHKRFEKLKTARSTLLKDISQDPA